MTHIFLRRSLLERFVRHGSRWSADSEPQRSNWKSLVGFCSGLRPHEAKIPLTHSGSVSGVPASVPVREAERQDREAERGGSCCRRSEPGGQDVGEPGEERLGVGSGAEGAGKPTVPEPQVPGGGRLLQQGHSKD